MYQVRYYTLHNMSNTGISVPVRHSWRNWNFVLYSIYCMLHTIHYIITKYDMPHVYYILCTTHHVVHYMYMCIYPYSSTFMSWNDTISSMSHYAMLCYNMHIICFVIPVFYVILYCFMFRLLYIISGFVVLVYIICIKWLYVASFLLCLTCPFRLCCESYDRDVLIDVFVIYCMPYVPYHTLHTVVNHMHLQSATLCTKTFMYKYLYVYIPMYIYM